MTAQDMQATISKTLRAHEVSILGMMLTCRTCGPVAQTQVEHQSAALTAILATPSAEALDTEGEDRAKLAKLLFIHPVSNGAAETAPEIIDLCEDAADAIFAAGYRKL